jgi:hypothetical protein
VVTRFGDVRVRCRLYEDAQSRSHLRLDEYLGWEKAQAATPQLHAQLVALASRLITSRRWRVARGLCIIIERVRTDAHPDASLVTSAHP